MSETEYDDLYVRTTLEERNQLPHRGKKLFHSPDIINWGTDPAIDPKELFSDNYGKFVSKDPCYEQENYVYVRAKNFMDGEQSGTVILFSTPKEHLSDPSQWQRLSNAEGNNSTPVTAQNTGDIAVTDTPFVWQPGQKPTANNPYSLVAVVYTEEHPNPLDHLHEPDFNFQKWFVEQGGVGWIEFQVAEPVTPGLTASCDVPLQVESEEGETLQLMLDCNNAIVGSYVSFSCDDINLPVTEVTSPNFNISSEWSVPANPKVRATFNYYAHGLESGEEQKIAFQVGKFEGSGGNQRLVILESFNLAVAGSGGS